MIRRGKRWCLQPLCELLFLVLQLATASDKGLLKRHLYLCLVQLFGSRPGSKCMPACVSMTVAI